MTIGEVRIPSEIQDEMHKALELCGYEECYDEALYAFMQRRGEDEVTIKVMEDFQDAFDGCYSSPASWAELRYSDLYREQLDNMPELEGHIDWAGVAEDVFLSELFYCIDLNGEVAIFDGWI